MVVGALVGMGALLLAAAVLSAGSVLRLHGAYREALRELRDGDRRLEPGAGPGRRLEDELRWYADVTAAGRDSGWRYAAVVVAGACAGAVVLAVWAIALPAEPLAVATAVVLLAAVLAVGVLCLLEGLRFERLLAAAGRRSALGGVRRLEDALVRVQRATAELRAARRIWLRTRSATYPLAAQLAAWRRRAVDRAAARRSRAVAALSRAVPVDIAGLSVRAPDGYPDGVRALTPLAAVSPDPPRSPSRGRPAGGGARQIATSGAHRATAAGGQATVTGGGPPAAPGGAGGGFLDDDTWAAAVADLSRAAERDGPRRTRWLSALAACAELRDDQPARESAARWALEAAALPPRTPGDPRTDLLPDSVGIEPTRPETWEGALRRARTVGAGPILLAEATLRWAYALVAAADEHDAAPTGGDHTAVPGSELDPAVAVAAEVMTETTDPDEYLARVRPGFESLGATSGQLSRLVPQWHAPTPAPTA